MELLTDIGFRIQSDVIDPDIPHRAFRMWRVKVNGPLFDYMGFGDELWLG